MSAVATFRRLSNRERLVLLESLLLLAACAVGLRAADLRRMRTRIRVAGVPTLSPGRLALLFHAVARRYPARCLVRSLALCWLLARHGFKSEVRIGVRRAGSELDAHAWVERDGAVLNDSTSVGETYIPLEPAEIPATPHWS
ncbi:MAG TPA: lasso peptide biosynthesis B2 protein [Terriglobales bacterium]|nr:lasso peptide biosynthesis B2 protein [Terriglobales bacterium]